MLDRRSNGWQAGDGSRQFGAEVPLSGESKLSSYSYLLDQVTFRDLAGFNNKRLGHAWFG